MEESDEGLPFACYVTYKRYCIDSDVFYRIFHRVVPDTALSDGTGG